MHYVVVGLGYGDEGKGATVDALSRREGAVATVRFSGGSNPAHHVELPSGRVYCFRQFGSGMILSRMFTLATKYMLIDPLSLLAEAESHEGRGVSNILSRIMIDGEALVITPFQWHINRLRETARADHRHGSVGRGVGETVYDSLLLGDEALRVKDLLQPEAMRRKLRNLQEIKITSAKEIISKHPESKDLHKQFKDLERSGYVEDLAWEYHLFSKIIKVTDEKNILKLINTKEPIVFEGTQGALLDPNYGFLPHVTKTDVTVNNAFEISNNTAVEKRVIGVLRAYFTRHGAGPFVTEDASLDGKISDLNNDTNEWQEKFRFGWFDLVAANYAIREANSGKIDELSITCLDSLNGFPEIRVCTSYEYRGDEDCFLGKYFEWDIFTGRKRIKAIKSVKGVEDLSRRTEILKQCVPFQYKIFAGWKNCFEKINSRYKLARQIENYLDFLSSKEGLGLPISIISTGPTWQDRTFRKTRA